MADDWDRFMDAAAEAHVLQRIEVETVRIGVLRALADAFKKGR